jgi:methionyl-tRNA formyltransferase
VTVHRVVAEADAGEILAQSRFALPRGYPVRALADRKQRAGAELLRDVLSRLDSMAAVAQDHGLATLAPRVPRGAGMVDFETWPAERVWHFLRGLHPFFVEPVGVEYGGVGQWRTHGHDRVPGAVEASAGGWLLYCVDGTVELTR